MTLIDDCVAETIADSAEPEKPSDTRPPINTKVDLDAIPVFLKAQKCWGLWRPVWRFNKAGRGRWEKVPLLSTNKPEDWLSFEEAVAQRGNQKNVGLGFCVTGTKTIIAFDLDHCLDDKGVPEAWASELINKLDCYTEVTVGGDGIRIFAKGHYEVDWINKDLVSLEVYSGHGGRFVTVTGNPYGGWKDIREVGQEVLDNIASAYRISGSKTATDVSEMPDLLEEVELPEGLNAEAAAFLEKGEFEKDRSAALNWTARCLIEAGLTTQQALSVLADNDYSMEVALDHRRQDEERALLYLWKHHVSPHRDVSPVAGVGDFAEDIVVDEVKERLDAGVRRLASMSPLVFSGAAKSEAKALGVGVVALRDAVKQERKRREQALKRKKGGVDYASPLPLLDEEGYPRNHIANLQEIIRRLEITCRYNIITHEEEILIPGEAFTNDNLANASFAWLESECSMFNFPTSKLQGFLTNICDRNVYNPVVTWVGSRKWDGTSRLQALYDTVVTEPEHRPLKEILIKRWMVSAIAGAFSPNGNQYHGMLVLQGEQSLGKTRWFLNLVPEDSGLAKEGMILQPGNKDSVTACCRYWLTELGELDATFRKSDISALKAFLTNQKDVLRVPFARKNSAFDRRTAFFASVNPQSFLHDETGNRRFWVVPCIAVHYEHRVDMQQVWAEVLELWRGGERSWLNRDEEALLNTSNEQFSAGSPIAELLAVKLNWKLDRTLWRWTSSYELLQELGIQQPTSGQLTSCGMQARKIAKRYGLELGMRATSVAKEMLVPYRRGVEVGFEDLV
jgi:putative DNA primase/helicase